MRTEKFLFHVLGVTAMVKFVHSKEALPRYCRVRYVSFSRLIISVWEELKSCVSFFNYS